MSIVEGILLPRVRLELTTLGTTRILPSNTLALNDHGYFLLQFAVEKRLILSLKKRLMEAKA